MTRVLSQIDARSGLETVREEDEGRKESCTEIDKRIPSESERDCRSGSFV